jgi:hypothetical protein
LRISFSGVVCIGDWILGRRWCFNGSGISPGLVTVLLEARDMFPFGRFAAYAAIGETVRSDKMLYDVNRLFLFLFFIFYFLSRPTPS